MLSAASNIPVLLIALVLATPAVAGAQNEKTNFFVTSVGPGKGGDLGGLAGADRHCSALAYNAGMGSVTWHAYLSATATDSQPAVNARDRIGTGPWYNFHGILIAVSAAQLHTDSAALSKATSVTEKGDTVKGRGDTPNQHDILTGSTIDGRAYPRGIDATCNNWTSSAASDSARVGHLDRQGGGENPTSWNSAHVSRGCGQQNLQSTGGNGLFYCFGIG
jgi:hypothetical protein